MTNTLKKYEEYSFFRFFEEICKIPHPSRRCKELSDFCVSFAKDRNLTYRQDENGNVIIWKEASQGRETDPCIMLQGHLDMVCVKKQDSRINFLTDGLQLETDGGKVYAKDTSLGADDGIAVAYALAILDDDTISHPSLEVVFTVDEEIGMLGANAISLDGCKANYLINLDSESDHVLWAGCAGGASVFSEFSFQREKRNGYLTRIEINGLKGGHSGAEIDKELANANVLMGRILNDLYRNKSFFLYEIKGGKADNVITNSCRADVVYTDLSDEETHELAQKVNELEEKLRREYQYSDPEIKIKFTVIGKKEKDVLSAGNTKQFLFFLRMAPYGIKHMSCKVDRLVETSVNIGIVTLDCSEASALFSVRSSVASRKDELISEIRDLTEYTGGTVLVQGDYPGWDIKKESKLREQMITLYQKEYGVIPEVKAIHAGLECGYFLQKKPDLDIVSIGPDIADIHSVDEKLDMPSAIKMYAYIVKVLENMK